MADVSKIKRPLNRDSVRKAHELIKPYIHHTPVLQCITLSDLVSIPQTPQALIATEFEGHEPAHPRMNLFFKCENYQKIGAFKARGAFHALSRLTQGELENGVITHSSGNHAQALACAARSRNIKAYVIMPTISTPSKIAATKGYGAEVHFSGSTEPERVALVNEIQARTGAILIPPYDHPDIILGQGTVGLEFETQVKDMLAQRAREDAEYEGFGWRTRRARRTDGEVSEGLDAVIAPCGGGGLLSGIATALAGTGISVFGAEPSFQGADDCKRGLAARPPTRVEHVSSLTIADGVRTPVGKIPWSVISDGRSVRGVHSVSEEQIKSAMRLLLERMKVMVEPCAALGLAVCMYDETFRRLVEKEVGESGAAWNVGIVLSGGNTTVEAIGKLFAPDVDEGRESGKVGLDGRRVAQDVAG